MKLADFLSDRKLTSAEFASMVGVSVKAVAKWRQGRRFPRAEVLERIHRATGGAVTANDFLPAAGTSDLGEGGSPS